MLEKGSRWRRSRWLLRNPSILRTIEPGIRTGRHLYKLAKRRISSTMRSILPLRRWAEVMMRKCGVEAFFDWQSGFFTDAVRAARIGSQVPSPLPSVVFLATEQSVARGVPQGLALRAMIKPPSSTWWKPRSANRSSPSQTPKNSYPDNRDIKGGESPVPDESPGPGHSQLWFVVKEGSQL